MKNTRALGTVGSALASHVRLHEVVSSTLTVSKTGIFALFGICVSRVSRVGPL